MQLLQKKLANDCVKRINYDVFTLWQNENSLNETECDQVEVHRRIVEQPEAIERGNDNQM